MQVYLNCVKCGTPMTQKSEETVIDEEGNVYTYHRCEGRDETPGCGFEVELAVSND